jgi:leucyl aminopeptidase
MITYKTASSSLANVRFVKTESPKDLTVRASDGTLTLEIGIERTLSHMALTLLPRRIIALARRERISSLSIDMSGLSHKLSPKVWGEMFAVGAEMANYAFTKYKTVPKEGWPDVTEISFIQRLPKSFWDGIERGRVIGDEVNRTRDLANTPGGDMTPELLAKSAVEALKGTKAQVTVLDVKEMEKLGMGAILGVGKGSDAPPRFIVIEWKGKVEKKPIVLVGKGVTFDTGGLNLKPGNSINDMHMDMSGGASVIHALSAIARLGLKKHVIGIVPAVENMPSGSSYRPGDVLRSMSGKTIEIGNTDAEGRVILADALTYAERYSPRLVVDVATLTGAACVALGDKCSALFTKSDTLARRLTEVGDEVGERTWRLPLWDEYEEGIKGTFGDWSNIGKGRDGGAIAGAIFLYQFAKTYPWAHFDIAPVMTTSDGQHLAKGASGVPLRTLVRLVEQF